MNLNKHNKKHEQKNLKAIHVNLEIILLKSCEKVGYDFKFLSTKWLLKI